MTCGFTPDEIRMMTLEDVRRLHSYWRRHPPTHLVAASFAGYKPKEDPDESVGVNLDEFMSAIPQVIPQ